MHIEVHKEYKNWAQRQMWKKFTSVSETNVNLNEIFKVEKKSDFGNFVGNKYQFLVACAFTNAFLLLNVDFTKISQRMINNKPKRVTDNKYSNYTFRRIWKFQG